jgi:hypothetical protein
MSRENVEVVRALHQLRPDDLVSGRREPTDLLDPEIEWLPASQSLLAGDRYHGHEGVRRFWTDLLSTWDEYLLTRLQSLVLDAYDRPLSTRQIRLLPHPLPQRCRVG